MKGFTAGATALFVAAAAACDSCYGPINHVEHVRHAKRIQPGAPEATYGPTRPLEWGQFNVLHTTDTHGWLEGHLKEANYGADFGDFISFTAHMKQQAQSLGVDLLLIDTGDLHDGTGLSDTTSPDGLLSDKVFSELSAYDLLTIGNHELYLADVAYHTFNDFSSFWGDKYLTSNVQIINPDTQEWEYVGKTHRYFTTENGLRIMAFGVLFDFTGNTNFSKVIPASEMVKQSWFTDAINTNEPVDLFLLIGHNIARPSTSGSTFQVVHNAIRAIHTTTPIQIFGGHSHVRDFAVVDEASTALESGRYCETVGWFSMSGFNETNSGRTGAANPSGVVNPTRKAIAVKSDQTETASPFVYSRRYLDWNRYTFQYHSVGSSSFDTPAGLKATDDVAAIRTQQRLGEVYGCVPAFYCQTCVPFGDPTNIFTVMTDAASEIVVNPNRANKARMIFSNTGGIRFDMHKGPFTYDDNFIVSPFRNVFKYIPDVPFADANNLIHQLNSGGADKRSLASVDANTLFGRDACVDPEVSLARRDASTSTPDSSLLGIGRRQVQETSGYITTDDFGTDGDDTAHSSIPSYSIPLYYMATGGYSKCRNPDKVDVVFVDFIQSYILSYLGSAYSDADVTPYISENFTSQDYLLPYVQKKWHANIDNCPL
ncbi:Ser/Thr protein phosphatase family protein [Sporothrix brasiliensis 5110]|uniref:Ser/Thr protein phosphatase family protein n=1 Tax=Sporothrix brasiliensis 5110 TaxID=1398154 RepID=A0A0C2J1W3_9PEZI|nr:Ser/Thr protein phosphatase family protein [Sporothrix brasiliensis 5110]KIH92990.1 Ser/Thr protein phosphatase family protein [Sporothrix brasiliensis 5110]